MAAFSAFSETDSPHRGESVRAVSVRPSGRGPEQSIGRREAPARPVTLEPCRNPLEDRGDAWLATAFCLGTVAHPLQKVDRGR